MVTATFRTGSTERRTLADLVARLGDIPLDRIRLQPPPGTASIDDLVQNNDIERNIRCELIDGTLVEKASVSYLEDSLTRQATSRSVRQEHGKHD